MVSLVDDVVVDDDDDDDDDDDVVVVPPLFVTSHYSHHCVHSSPISTLPPTASPLRQTSSNQLLTIVLLPSHPPLLSQFTSTPISRLVLSTSIHTIAHRKAHSMEIIAHPLDSLHLPF